MAPNLAAAVTIISGQQCTDARRVLVHACRATEMKQALAAPLAEVRLGHGLEATTQMCPLIDHCSRDRVEQRIRESMDSCDEVLLAGSRPGDALGSGAFFCQEEIFGALLVLETFEAEAEAVGRANHTEFGLSASVWTRDGARAMRLARALRNGTVWINDHNKLFAEAETGGYRKSGLGHLHGYDALLDFTELKHVYQNVGTL